ncbi:PHP domain-containing protein [Rarobacter incanus]|uniref:Polymerase/histidinol phosphatase N-terminal domain-containing protein n=1 Tax=Rarobacter incanus TaxID=153494 RepID=A0A542SRE1_9MICO|nr:PHP domain-containing protein [Rarobacter incanus]TQK77158.1 hypothetical protein FB389_1873 [Rarobacter incanus]
MGSQNHHPSGEFRADLHTHSTASDGTTSPRDVVAAAAAAGLDAVGITDHDTTAGWAEAARAAASCGVTLVRGAEISSAMEKMSVHMLGYLFDPDNADLRREFELVRSDRVTRAERMVDNIAADLPLTWQDVLEQTPQGATVGRPHIADALVAKGIVRDRDEAFADILAAHGRYFVRHYAIDSVRAVELVRAAGGVPVIAHPGATIRGKTLSTNALEQLVEAGLLGIEVYHRDHDAKERVRLRDFARRHDLIVTGSSDYHGAGKKNRLGENLTEPVMVKRIAAAAGVPVLGRLPQ